MGVAGRSIAFYGFGAVARAVHKLALGFGMKTFAYDPYIPKEAIAAQGATPVDSPADLFDYQYVTLHVPLTPETKDSINKELLMKMPKGATLINTGAQRWFTRQRCLRFSAHDQTSATSPMYHPRMPRK